MTTVRLLEPVAPADLVAIGRLHDVAEIADGHPSLNDAVWRALETPEPASADSAGALAVEGEEAVGYAHAARGDNVTRPHWDVGLVVHPEHRSRGIEAELLEAIARLVGARGGGLAVLWVLGVDDPRDDRVDAAVAPAAFVPQRDLLEMRVPLPLPEEPAWPPGTEVRAFVPGADDDAWLAVNNRAFADHPEQGGWTEAALRRRMTEPWFDPAGFLLAVDDDGLAGFCWTKVHPPQGPGDPEPVGEIYVIGVDPSRHGRGLGRALVLAGLSSLAERGVTAGMLFVDGANAAALGLYESLGFTTHRRDRAYSREVVPA